MYSVCRVARIRGAKMKTKGFGKILILGLAFTSLFACKEEEFYEKEFIDTLSEQYERENLPEDFSEDDYEEEAEVDLDNPNGNITGTNPDGTIPGGTPPVGDNGGTPPGSNPGDDGTPPGNGDDGTPPGNGDGGTPPGDDYNPPGDDDDNNPPPGDDYTPPSGVTLKDISDDFKQNANGLKLDILWVIDDSGSMDDEQEALGENFDAFIKEFVNKDIDFQMAITTTDTYRSNAGKVYKDSMDRLTSAKLKENKEQFMADFAELVKVGVNGSGYEKGLYASKAFASKYGSSWMRSDAYLTVVYMSDEADQSRNPVEYYLDSLKSWKANDGLIKAYSIVDLVPYEQRGGITRGHERYKAMSDATGGKITSIKQDFYDTLLDMGEEIANLSEQFPLSIVPYNAATIKVFVNGIAASGWSYDAASNSIKFAADSIPGPDSEIEVQYSIEE